MHSQRRDAAALAAGAWVTDPSQNDRLHSGHRRRGPVCLRARARRRSCGWSGRSANSSSTALRSRGGRQGALDDDARRKPHAAYSVDRHRTVHQDAGYGIRQIVDVALKALSPGINDTTTAINCIDFLGAILARLAQRSIETPYRADGGAGARRDARADVSGPAGRSLRSDPPERRRQRRRAETPAAGPGDPCRERTTDDRAAPALRLQADLIVETAARSVPAEVDRATIEAARAAGVRGSARAAGRKAGSDAGWIHLVGPERAVEFLGVRLVGLNADNGMKLLFTLVFIARCCCWASAASACDRGARGPALTSEPRSGPARRSSWARRSLLILGLLSIWFDDPTRLTTALGLVTAGLAFALQKVVTAVAGYFVILRGKTFNVGDRIVDGRRARRRDRARLHPDDDHGDGPAAAGPGRRPGDVGAKPPVHRAASSRSPTRRSSTSRSSTTRATSPTSGRRWRCRSPTPPTATAPSASCWRSPSRHTVQIERDERRGAARRCSVATS